MSAAEPSTSKTSTNGPTPSTSFQSMPANHNHQTSNTSNEILMKKKAKPEPEPMKELPNPSRENHLILPPVNIKTEELPQAKPLQALPPPKICDQNNANVSNVPNQSTANVVKPVLKGNTKKTFIKCVSKDGKVSLMELIQDEKNPKLFKMVLPQGLQANKLNLQQSLPALPTPTQSIKIVSALVNASGVKISNIQNIVGTHSSNTKSSLINQNSINSASLSVKSPSQSLNSIKVPLYSPNVSSNSPNSSKTLPKLVAINSPLPPAYSSLTHGTQIIKKNNKVLDPSRVSKTQQSSLLKPQVSLLKPRSPATGKNILKKITVSNISGIEHKNINVFIPADVKIGTNVSSKLQYMHQRFDDELEKEFMQCQIFSNVTEAVGWLLKKVPLISPMAIQPGFRECFPFVLSSLAEFHSLHVAKQRSYEVISSCFEQKYC